MQRTEVYERLNAVFREVFDDADLLLTDATTAVDVPGWDSLVHISLLGAVEAEFGMEFDMREVVGMQNVGEMADAVIGALAADGR